MWGIIYHNLSITVNFILSLAGSITSLYYLCALPCDCEEISGQALFTGARDIYLIFIQSSKL